MWRSVDLRDVGRSDLAVRKRGGDGIFANVAIFANAAARRVIPALAYRLRSGKAAFDDRLKSITESLTSVPGANH